MALKNKKNKIRTYETVYGNSIVDLKTKINEMAEYGWELVDFIEITGSKFLAFVKKDLEI